MPGSPTVAVAKVRNFMNVEGWLYADIIYKNRVRWDLLAGHFWKRKSKRKE